MPPSARHTPVVALCLATSPRSAMERLPPCPGAISNPRCAVPTLNWIGKDAVVRHHKEVPFRLLEA